MRFFYSDTFTLPLPDGHRFPISKYELLRRRLLEEDILQPDQLELSPLARTEDVLLAHDQAYVEAFESGALDPKAMRRIGLPWSEGLVERTRATTGGAVEAARRAMQDGLSGQLAGGTHHAHRDFGSGYCVYNDFAVAALSLLEDGTTGRIAIIDLDVHQGDGNASILSPREDVFVFSMHGQRNFPFRKFDGDLDVGLPDGMEDEAYLRTLSEHLPAVFAFRPDLVLYQAGVDALEQDKLGRLALSHDGLRRRDEMVLALCKAAGLPVSMAIGGGYADPIEPTVAAYANTYSMAKTIYGF